MNDDKASELAREIAQLFQAGFDDAPCGHDIYDRTSRIYGCCRPKGHEGPHETLDDRHKQTYANERNERKDGRLLKAAALLRPHLGEERCNCFIPAGCRSMNCPQHSKKPAEGGR